MHRTFSNPSRKWLVTVDDEGVHEHRRGRHSVSIGWNGLESLSHRGVRGERGERISLWLSPERRREFELCVGEIWRLRSPERWQRNHDRTWRARDWAVCFWFPILTLGSCLVCYALLWLAGWPKKPHPDAQQIHYLTALAVVSVIGIAIHYHFSTRKRR